MESKISFQLTPEELTEVNAAIAKLNEVLSPKLIALTPEERKTTPKISDKTLAFIEKSLEYIESSPEFAPPYLNVDEMKVDKEAFDQLRVLFNQLNQITSNLDDTMILSGSETYIAALSYYNSVKQAAKISVPNAKVIYEDLRKRFDRPSKKVSE